MANEERAQQIAARWSNRPTEPVTLVQELFKDKQSIHKETVDVQALWDAPVEILRGYAHRALILDAQKAVKSKYEQNDAAAEKGEAPKHDPDSLSIQSEYERLLTTFPSVQGITVAPGGNGKKVDPLEELAKLKATMDPSEFKKLLKEKGLI